MSEVNKRYTFHFIGTDVTFSSRMSDADRELLFGVGAKTCTFATFWGDPTVIVNLQNVTYVEVAE